VAQAPTRAASTLLSMPAEVKRGCRDESRHGTHECVRHSVVTFSLRQPTTKLSQWFR
jgi:hypothetical protein